MRIIIPEEAPENMGKALTEAFDLIGTQLNDIADKYGCMVDATAYTDDGDGSGKQLYISAVSKELIVSCYVYLTGRNAEEEQHASVTERI